MADHGHDDSNRDFTSRPATKRIRSDEDHSKAATKDREDKKQGKEDGGDNKDEDWKSKPPFCVGASKEGWTTKWRESCWCGKSLSLLPF